MIKLKVFLIVCRQLPGAEGINRSGADFLTNRLSLSLRLPSLNAHTRHFSFSPTALYCLAVTSTVTFAPAVHHRARVCVFTPAERRRSSESRLIGSTHFAEV